MRENTAELLQRAPSTVEFYEACRAAGNALADLLENGGVRMWDNLIYSRAVGDSVLYGDADVRANEIHIWSARGNREAIMVTAAHEALHFVSGGILHNDDDAVKACMRIN